MLGGMQELSEADYERVLARSRGAALVCFAIRENPALDAIRLVLESAGASREWSLFWVDPLGARELTRQLGVRALPALWLYVDGDYHADVLAVAGPDALRRPQSLAAAVAQARLGPPMPPPGA